MPLKAILTYVDIKSTSPSYVISQALSSYINLSAADITVDPYTLNLYFTALQDSPDALTVNLSESLAHSTSLSKADIATLAEAAALSVSLVASDTTSLSDSSVWSASLSKSESFSMAEAIALASSSVEAETLSMSDSASLLVTAQRVFSDAFTLDDTSSVSDVLKTDVYMAKGNIANLSESLSFSFNTPYSDSATMSESLNYLVVGKVLNSAVLNASVLN